VYVPTNGKSVELKMAPLETIFDILPLPKAKCQTNSKKKTRRRMDKIPCPVLPALGPRPTACHSFHTGLCSKKNKQKTKLQQNKHPLSACSKHLSPPPPTPPPSAQKCHGQTFTTNENANHQSPSGQQVLSQKRRLRKERVEPCQHSKTPQMKSPSNLVF